MNYGIYIKKARLEKGLTQKEMANFLHLSKYTYSHYETQDTTIPINHLSNLCDYLEISIDYAFNLINKQNYTKKFKNINLELSGKRLKEFRKENKITQKKLSDLLNIDRTVLSKYETGKYPIATPFLYTICKKYNVSADYLLGKIDYIPKW